MTPTDTYKNWKAVTEADFVSLFIKTWFAYISLIGLSENGINTLTKRILAIIHCH